MVKLLLMGWRWPPTTTGDWTVQTAWMRNVTLARRLTATGGRSSQSTDRRTSWPYNIISSIRLRYFYVDAYLLEEQSCLPNFITMRFETTERVATTRRTRWVAIWDHFLIKQESWAIAKMTARCALCMGAMKIFGSPWLRPWLLFSKFLMGFCSDWAYKCACKIWSL